MIVEIKVLPPAFTEMDFIFLGFVAVFFILSLIILLRRDIRRKVNFRFSIVTSAIYYHFLLLDMGLSTPYGLAKCGAMEQNTYLAYLLWHIGWLAYPSLIILQLYLFFSVLLIIEFILTRFKNSFWKGFWKGILIPFIILLCGLHLGATINNFKLC